MPADDAFLDELRQLLADGQKLQAIKLYRELTGTGLAEAKAAVEALERGATIELPTRDSPNAPQDAASLEAQIVGLLGQGQFVEAVRFYRRQNGGGLKESKQAVEAIARRYNIPVPSGCFGMLLAMVGIAGGVGWAWFG